MVPYKPSTTDSGAVYKQPEGSVDLELGAKRGKLTLRAERIFLNALEANSGLLKLTDQKVELAVAGVDYALPGEVGGNYWVKLDSTIHPSTTSYNVAIGLTAASAKLHILSTSEQLRLAYNSQKYTSFTMDNDGAMTIRPYSVVGDGNLVLDANNTTINHSLTINTLTGMLKSTAGLVSVSSVGTDYDNYWTRTGTTMSPRTLTDSLSVGVATTTSLAEFYSAGDSTLTITSTAEAGLPQINYKTDASPTVKFCQGVQADDSYIINHGATLAANSDFIITAAGDIGIGTLPTTGVKLDILYAGGIGTTPSGLRVQSNNATRLEVCSYHDDSYRVPGFIYKKARGTKASPTTVVSSDYLGRFDFFAHDGNDMETTSAMILVKCNNTVSTNIIPGEIEFWVAPPTGADAIQEVMIIDYDGVEIGRNGSSVRSLKIFTPDDAAGTAISQSLQFWDGAGSYEGQYGWTYGMNTSINGNFTLRNWYGGVASDYITYMWNNGGIYIPQHVTILKTTEQLRIGYSVLTYATHTMGVDTYTIASLKNNGEGGSTPAPLILTGSSINTPDYTIIGSSGWQDTGASPAPRFVVYDAGNCRAAIMANNATNHHAELIFINAVTSLGTKGAIGVDGSTIVITNGLTVAGATQGIFIDTSNYVNIPTRLGINCTPAQDIEINGGSGDAVIQLTVTDHTAYLSSINTVGTTLNSGAMPLFLATNGVTVLTMTVAGDATFAQKVGIGIAPTELLHVYALAATASIKIETDLTDGTAGLNLTNDARSYYIKVAGDNADSLVFRDVTGGGDRLTLTNAGYFGVGGTPGSKLDLWAGDFHMSNSNVDHGMTGYFPTTTFFSIDITSATIGGASVYGVTDADSEYGALRLTGIFGADPTDTYPAIIIRGAQKSGTSITDLGAADTVLGVRNNATELITVKGDGTTNITKAAGGYLFGAGSNTTTDKGLVYIAGAAINCYYGRDTDGLDLAINYEGYSAGNTRDRDVSFYDGKRVLVAFIDGSEKSFNIGTNSSLTGRRLYVIGDTNTKARISGTGSASLELTDAGATANRKTFYLTSDADALRFGVMSDVGADTQLAILNYNGDVTLIGNTLLGTAVGTQRKLSVCNGTCNISLFNGGSNEGVLATQTNHKILIETNSTTALELDTSQNVSLTAEKILYVDHIAEKTGGHATVVNNKLEVFCTTEQFRASYSALAYAKLVVGSTLTTLTVQKNDGEGGSIRIL